MNRLVGPAALLAALVASASFASEPEKTVPVYLGTGAKGEEAGIYLSELDLLSGDLAPPRHVATLPGAGFVVLHPSRRFLYATTRRKVARGEPNGGVAAFRVSDDGGLEPLGEVRSSGGSGPCHVTLDPSGKTLLVANYGSGSVASLPIGEDGSLGAPGSVRQHAGSGADPKRQAGPHAHSIHPSPDGRFAYAADLGIDRVMIYALDAATATLTPAGEAKVAPGSGPRHLKLTADGARLYLLNEMALTVTVFDRDAGTGALTEAQTISALPEGADPEKMSCSEIRIHPNGRFVTVANRDLTEAGRDSLSTFAIGEDGQLARVQTIGAEVWIPRNFELASSGRWLLVAGQRSSEVSVFGVDPATGELSFTGKKLALPTAMCVEFVDDR